MVERRSGRKTGMKRHTELPLGAASGRPSADVRCARSGAQTVSIAERPSRTYRRFWSARRHKLSDADTVGVASPTERDEGAGPLPGVPIDYTTRNGAALFSG